MKKPDFQDTIEVLHLKSAREILRQIVEEPKTVREIHDELKGNEHSLSYRESVFKSLERMVEAGLVEKIQNGKRVSYRSSYSKIEMDLLEDKLNLEER